LNSNWTTNIKTMQKRHECTTNKTSSFNFIKTTNHYLFLLNSLWRKVNVGKILKLWENCGIFLILITSRNSKISGCDRPLMPWYGKGEGDTPIYRTPLFMCPPSTLFYISRNFSIFILSYKYLFSREFYISPWSMITITHTCSPLF
jgi:hypothetical protein